MKLVFNLLLVVFSTFLGHAQQTIIQGNLIDARTLLPVIGVSVEIENTPFKTVTDAQGIFLFSNNLPLGEQTLVCTKENYTTIRIPIIITGKDNLNLSEISLEPLNTDNDLYSISLSDDELNDDTDGTDNISGLLSASYDAFQRAAAFEFSASFFKPRGLDANQSTVQINGIAMNKAFNGRPQWNNWGGLNDVMRFQEISYGLSPSLYTFGGALGSVNISARASNFKSGGQITYSTSNRSYTNRVMASYTTGILKNGWALAFMGSRRWGDEGFFDATQYQANSFYISAEKKLNAKHSLNFSGIFANTQQGKSSPNTQEVYQLKGIKYNEYWGWQDNKKRNSRIKNTNEPIVMLNHYWNISKKTQLNTNIAYQFGTLKNSRLDYSGTRLNDDGVPIGGGANPSPTYYQKMPSYWLAEKSSPNYSNAYLSEQELINNGQINWNYLYETNLNNPHNYSTYMLYNDVSKDTQLTLNSILQSSISNHITLQAALNFNQLTSHNFAEISDLLGGQGYLNRDAFDGYQYDLKNPNFIAGVDDKIKYNYNLNTSTLSGFLQAQFKYKKTDFYVATQVSNSQYQREGLFQNEANLNNSLGKSESLQFNNISLKSGITYKLTGKHVFTLNTALITKAPTLQNSFVNPRSNNSTVPNIKNTQITSVDLSYNYQSPTLKARITGFLSQLKHENEVSFYYADGVIGFSDDAEFVTEILQGIQKQNLGCEIGIEAQITPSIKLKGAASLGQYTYLNNPNVTLTSNAEISNLGPATLKNYKLAVGPQQASSFGIEYRDPKFWWIASSVNFFSHTYIDISPITRTKNFYLNPIDGKPFNDYDEALAYKLLKQEQFKDYMVLNLVGGKSWRIKNNYVGFLASIGNALNKTYKTGGFEQSRNANFRQLQNDYNNNTPVFAPKYWYGRGANYFINVYIRF